MQETDQMLAAEDKVDLAIHAEGLCKFYGGCRNKWPVLNNLNMRVPSGAIYGLLGPSGCGKTTLLRILVGLHGHNGGTLQVLGRPPGTPGHGVPGKRIGYMPQVAGLHRLLTIEEILIFFGRLYGMAYHDIQNRIEFLMNFFQLPPKTQLFGTLSGGQQRRTSFAVALIHEPELLILDEPTVGVDPVLRNKIWDYMMKLSRNYNTTILITTLYINEVVKADVVGMMRHGRLLAEAPPSVLMARLTTTSLEETFKYLCLRDEGQGRDSPDLTQSFHDVKTEQIHHRYTDFETVELTEKTTDERVTKCSLSTESPEIQSTESDETETPLLGKTNSGTCVKPSMMARKSRKRNFSGAVTPWQCMSSYVPNPWVIYGIVVKNCQALKRNYGLLIMALIIAPPNICQFVLTLSGHFNDLPMAVVNQDSSNIFPGKLPELGASYLSFIDDKKIRKNEFASMAEARQSVLAGNHWGIMQLTRNFTNDTITRLTTDPSKMSDEQLDNTKLHLYLDNTNPMVDLEIIRVTLKAYLDFSTNTTTRLRKLMPETGQPLTLPFQMEEPIYGKKKPSMREYIAPGAINLVSFFMACGLTASVIVDERKIGLMNRSFSANAGILETLLAHVITQLPMLAIQVFAYIFSICVVFQIQIEGSYILMTLLTFAQGIAGMMLGLLLSVLADREDTVYNLVLSVFFPTVVISGSVWPMQAVLPWLRILGQFIPCTQSAVALRDIMQRGWGLENTEVQIGFLATFSWIAGLLVICVIVCKLKDI